MRSSTPASCAKKPLQKIVICKGTLIRTPWRSLSNVLFVKYHSLLQVISSNISCYIMEQPTSDVSTVRKVSPQNCT